MAYHSSVEAIMSSLLVKLQAEYHSILFSKTPTPEQLDRRTALACLLAEVQLGWLTKDQQIGDDRDVILAGEAWLTKIDIIYDPRAKTIWSGDDIVETHRVRKHIIEIIEGFKKTA
jgi:hypothetical protein